MGGSALWKHDTKGLSHESNKVYQLDPRLSTLPYPALVSCSSIRRLLYTYHPLPLHLTHKAAPSHSRPFYMPRLGTNLCILYSCISTPSPQHSSLSLFYTPAPVPHARSSVFYPILSTFSLSSPHLPRTLSLYHCSASPQFYAPLFPPFSSHSLFLYRRVAP